MKQSGKIAALAATLSLLAISAQAERAPGKMMQDITKAEALEKAAERFDRADTNGDGILSRERCAPA